MRFRERTSMATIVLLTMVASIANRGMAGEPRFNSGLAIRMAIAYLEREHPAKKRVDDVLARQWYQEILNRLDPRKMYFVDADLNEFKPFADQLAALARKRNFEFAELVRTRYRTRVAEAAGYASQALDASHNFTQDEELPLTYDDYSADAAELRERWRLRIKAEQLAEKAHDTPAAETKSWLKGRYERIARQARDMSDERLCQVFLDPLCALYDPHSTYYTPAEINGFSGSSFLIKTHRLAWERPLDLIDWELIAIRRLDGSIQDVVEMHSADLRSMISSENGPLKSDTDVILEFMNPVTYERLSVSCGRFALWVLSTTNAPPR